MEQRINLKAVKITLMKGETVFFCVNSSIIITRCRKLNVDIFSFVEPLVAVTIFTIEMLPGNRTLYKMCGRYNYTNSGPGGGPEREPRRFVTDSENQISDVSSLRHRDAPGEQITLEVACENQDAVGHFIFIRDDRKKEDFFKVCEVEVFSHSQGN